MGESNPQKRPEGVPRDPARDPDPPESATDPERRSCLVVGLGVGLVILGVPMLALPGPGILTIAAGVGLIAMGRGKKQDEPA
jgi:hypothetical protein